MATKTKTRTKAPAKAPEVEPVVEAAGVDPIVEATEKEQARINAIPHDPKLDSLPTDTQLLMALNDKMARIIELIESRNQPFDMTKWYK